MKISKLDAARRQLDGAIQLWFYEGDQAAIHALACGAQQIVQDINEKNGQMEFSLSEIVKKAFPPEQVSIAMQHFKDHRNFFQHANRDPHAILEFEPLLSENMINMAIGGLRKLGERVSDLQNCFVIWDNLHASIKWNRQTRKTFAESLPVEILEKLRATKKQDFLQGCLFYIAQQRSKGIGPPL